MEVVLRKTLAVCKREDKNTPVFGDANIGCKMRDVSP